MQDRWLALKPLVAVRLALSAALVVGLVACQGAGSSSHFFASLGTTTSEVNLLILVAQEQGYFASNGLQIVHQTYPSGRAAVGALMDHEVDLVTGSEFAFAGQVLMHEDIGILAAINRSSLEYLVARLESGINDIDDLKGKTIGVPLGSRPEFALHRYLYLHGIDVSDLALVDVPVEQAVDALTSGKVDAVAAWQPYIDEATEELDGRVISWSVQEDQPSYSLLMSRGKWAAENPELITRLLRSLVQAEEHVTQNPGAAISLLEERWSYELDYLTAIWPEHQFSVLLDQALVVALEDQARWIMSRDTAAEQEMPDFRDHIYADGLETVNPEAVSLIR